MNVSYSIMSNAGITDVIGWCAIVQIVFPYINQNMLATLTTNNTTVKIICVN